MNPSFFRTTTEQGVASVVMNRPEKVNALDQQAWTEMKEVFDRLSEDPACRVVVLSGEGKHFCAGIDLAFLMQAGQQTQHDCEGRRREALRNMVLNLQAAINAIDQCKKPVIAMVHGACVGAGVDIVTACDMRYSTADAFFQVKEIDMGMVADVGTLQRLPRLIADGIARELCYTGRKMPGSEAEKYGLVNAAYSTTVELKTRVEEVARNISAKSPLSIRGTKEMLQYGRDHSIEDGLRYIATWNAAMLLSEDLAKAVQAAMTKSGQPEFRD